MRAIRLTAFSLVICVPLPGAAVVVACDSNSRKEIKRGDLSDAPGIKVVSSIVEYKTGKVAARHFHHCIETACVIRGSMIQ